MWLKLFEIFFAHLDHRIYTDINKKHISLISAVFNLHMSHCRSPQPG